MWTGKKYCIGVVGVVCFTWNDNIVLFILIADKTAVTIGLHWLFELFLVNMQEI